MVEAVLPDIDPGQISPSVRRGILTAWTTGASRILPASGVISLAPSTTNSFILQAPVPGNRLDIVSITASSSDGTAATVTVNATGVTLTSTGGNRLTFIAGRQAATLIGLTDTTWGIFSTVAGATGTFPLVTTVA